MKVKKVLVIATSKKTKGGITSVVKAHSNLSYWRDWNCKWVETHLDKSKRRKIIIFFKAISYFFINLPFYSIIHIHLSWPGSAKRKLPFLIIAYLLRKKIIVHIHASAERTIEDSPKLYKYIFNLSDVVITLYPSFFDNEILDINHKVIFNPCIQVIDSLLALKKKQILFAGALNKEKGVFDLIKAFSNISNKFPEWELVFAGVGLIKECQELSRSLNISDRTYFLGWVEGDKKNELFKQSSVFCLPSYTEGFPMSILDAWSFGLPVITTPVGGIPDIVKDNKNGLLFDVGDINQLTSCLFKMMLDPQLRERLSLESLKLARTKFSLQTINKQMDDLYSNLLNS